MEDSAQAEVLKAAQDLVARFAAHDTEGYFAAFSPEATFIFYTTSDILGSRAQYRALWQDWEVGGFRVLDCHSFDPMVHIYGDTAIFTHRVKTRLLMGGVEQTSTERETIVFQRQTGGEWLAIHEHLSPYGDT